MNLRAGRNAQQIEIISRRNNDILNLPGLFYEIWDLRACFAKSTRKFDFLQSQPERDKFCWLQKDVSDQKRIRSGIPDKEEKLK